MRIFLHLTKEETRRFNLRHVTRGAQGGPRRDQRATLARRRRPPASTRRRRVQERARTPDSNPGADPTTSPPPSAVLLPREAMPVLQAHARREGRSR